MSNDNVLEGLACPSCGSEEPFNIEVTTIVRAWDSGTEDTYADNEWTDESYADCGACTWAGTVGDMRQNTTDAKRS